MQPVSFQHRGFGAIVESLTAPSHLQIDHARHDTLRPVMAKPSVDSFRAEPLLQQPFVRTSITNIAGAINRAFYDHGFDGAGCIFAAAHLLALSADDSAHVGDEPALAVDLGTAGGLANDVMDGGRRTISVPGAGAQPGVAAGAQDDIFWSLTVFGRRALALERRQAARPALAIA